MAAENQEQAALAGAVVIGISAIAGLIEASRMLYPVFEFFLFLSILGLVASLILKSAGAIKVSAGGVILFLALSGTTHAIGYGVGNSDAGQAILRMDATFDNVSQAETEAMNAFISAGEEATMEAYNESNVPPQARVSTRVTFKIARVYVAFQSLLPWTPY